MSNIQKSITAVNDQGRLALAAFLTAGFPDKERFVESIARVTAAVDVLELGVPFSDPMADGVSIQYASHEALRQGVTLRWILDVVGSLRSTAPVVLMSYMNPLLAFGSQKLARMAADVGVAGFIVPDLPYEEAQPFHSILRDHGIDLIQLVTPSTPDDRLEMICNLTGGFVYAVTMTGTTGGHVTHSEEMAQYLARVRRFAQTPVMAGFGIRTPEHVRQFAGHANGVIVGSALVDMLRAGQDPEPFLEALRTATFVDNEVLK